MKLLEDIGVNVCDPWLGGVLLHMIPKTPAIRGKDNPQTGRKYLWSHIYYKELIYRTYKELSKFNDKKYE